MRLFLRYRENNSSAIPLHYHTMICAVSYHVPRTSIRRVSYYSIRFNLFQCFNYNTATADNVDIHLHADQDKSHDLLWISHATIRNMSLPQLLKPRALLH